MVILATFSQQQQKKKKRRKKKKRKENSQTKVHFLLNAAFVSLNLFSYLIEGYSGVLMTENEYCKLYRRATMKTRI